MAISGSFMSTKNGNTSYADDPRWGDGASAEFAVRGGPGRSSTPDGNPVGDVPSDLVGADDVATNDYGYTDDDMSSPVWGAGVQSGTADRPGWEPDRPEINDRVNTGVWPSYGNSPAGRPSGNFIRSINRGAIAANTMKATQPSLISRDTSPPDHGAVEDSVVSDTSQLFMQTSMTQRDKVRQGSQAQAGRANADRAPIASRITGQRIKNIDSNPSRHGDMAPKSQDLIIRPWWTRTAGTGNKNWMKTNERFVPSPMQRNAPDNPYAGPAVGDGTDAYLGSAFGYTSEDVTY